MKKETKEILVSLGIVGIIASVPGTIIAAHLIHGFEPEARITEFVLPSGCQNPIVNHSYLNHRTGVGIYQLMCRDDEEIKIYEKLDSDKVWRELMTFKQRTQ